MVVYRITCAIHVWNSELILTALLDLKTVVLGIFMVAVKPLFEDLFIFVKLVVVYQKSAHLEVGSRQCVYIY